MDTKDKISDEAPDYEPTDKDFAEHFRTAVLFVIKKRGRGEQARVARDSEVGASYLNDILKGRKDGTEHIRRKIAWALKIPYEALLELGLAIKIIPLDDSSFNDLMRLSYDDKMNYAFSIKESFPEESEEEFITIEMVDAKPSGGGGSLQTSDKVVKTLKFRSDWLKGKTLGNTKKIKAMSVDGESMSNTINNGDIILVNENDKELKEGKIFVIRVGREIYVKRFFKAQDKYLFQGDNRDLKHLDVEIDLNDEGIDWSPIAKVLWVGKEV